MLGQALDEALGDRAGIRRYGSALVPMDESLAECAIDISGRPYCAFEADLPTTSIAGFDTELAEEFFRAVANSAKLTLHIVVREGTNAHHMIEASFKAFARALRVAVSVDPEESGVPSTKGTLSSEGTAGPMTTQIAILDYGMGNLRSVEKALEHVGASASITADPAAVRAADGVILPGVGAFPRAMERVRERGLDELIEERRAGGRADPRHLPRPAAALRLDHRAGRGRGARPAPGPVAELDAEGLKVPHIGWSPVRWERESRLVEGIETETPFYFVHSFVPAPRPGRAAGQRRLRRPLRLRGRSATTSTASSSTRRSRAPPACGCSPTSPGSARRSRRDPLSGHRHPRRPGGAPAAGRLRARDRV